MALLHVLERLAPEERAAFLLHDAFDYDYGELAALLGKSEAACRQTVSRARRRIHDGHARFDASAASTPVSAAAFGSAIASANPRAYRLHERGCRLPCRMAAVRRSRHSTRSMAPIMSRASFGVLKKTQGTIETQPVSVNGRPGFLLTSDEKLEAVLTFGIADGRIAAIYAMRNPQTTDACPVLAPGVRTPCPFASG